MSETTRPIITLTNQKGGVGKTTTAAALIDGMRRRGARVLAVDCDAQGSLSSIQRPWIVDGTCSTSDFIKGRDIIPTKDGQATVPAFEDLVLIDQEPGVTVFSLKKAIEKASEKYDFDCAVIDTHPDKQFCAISALVAATYIVIPTTADRFGIEGIKQSVDFISDVSEIGGNDWSGRIGALVTLFKTFTILHEQIYGQLKEQLPSQGIKLFNQRIANNIQIARAQAEGVSIYESQTVFHGAVAQYDWFVNELIQWIKKFEISPE